jgi:telomere length regulation protein
LDTLVCADWRQETSQLIDSDAISEVLITNLLLRLGKEQEAFSLLFGQLAQLEQRKFLFAVLKYLSDNFLNKLDADQPSSHNPTISAAAGVINSVVGSDETRRSYLVMWLTSATGAGLGDGVGIRRAVVSVLGQDRDCVGTALEKSLNQFGDQLYIKHSPMLQQEGRVIWPNLETNFAHTFTVHAQVLLMCAGYVHRLNPIKLTMLTRSGTYLHMVSNRIGASQTRARFLGIVVAESVSSLVDKGEKKLDFHMEETDTEEARWYKDLLKVTDSIGSTELLLSKPAPALASQGPKSWKQKSTSQEPKPVIKAQLPKSGFIIEEVVDDGEGEEDMIPYAKPDSDPEDSDEDPTLVVRNKPKAPVYIRDLILYFRDTDNYDRHKLALTSAPILIRRKANFGAEVSSHTNELASILVSLQDKYELENFYELRLQGMIALVTAQPQKMSPWFAKTFYDGDYSVSQRASILIVLGLSARELAGFDASEYASAAAFPSKMLPDRMERLYLDNSATANKLPSSSSLKALPANALDAIAQSLTNSFLAPMTANAADAATGPDVLKLSSFTSRLQAKDSKGNSSKKSKSKIRAIPNTTASLLSTAFFFPLTARFQHAMRSSSSRSNAVIFQPYLLSLYLKTLGIVIHAAGPSTLALPQMTAELWDLMLGVRGHCVGDMVATHALLMALAAMLDVNGEGSEGMRGLCERHGREVVESQEWVGAVFEGIRGDDGGLENEVKMLAAGILIKLREAVEKYRALLMGDMIGFT